MNCGSVCCNSSICMSFVGFSSLRMRLRGFRITPHCAGNATFRKLLGTITMDLSETKNMITYFISNHLCCRFILRPIMKAFKSVFVYSVAGMKRLLSCGKNTLLWCVLWFLLWITFAVSLQPLQRHHMRCGSSRVTGVISYLPLNDWETLLTPPTLPAAGFPLNRWLVCIFCWDNHDCVDITEQYFCWSDHVEPAAACPKAS